MRRRYRQADMQDATLLGTRTSWHCCATWWPVTSCPGIPFSVVLNEMFCRGCRGKLCSAGIQEWIAWLQSRRSVQRWPRVKRRRRVESSSPQSGSDFSNFLDVRRKTWVWRKHRSGHQHSGLPQCHPAQFASTVPASLRVLREVHPGGISVQVPTTPGGSDISIFEQVRCVDKNRPER